MNTHELKAHPLAAIFPPMTEAELSALAESIAKHGLREAIVTLDGDILDGLNRLKACNMVNAGAHFREFGSRETDGTSPTAFVADANLRHRFLDTSQRIAMATKMLPFYEAEAATKAEALNVVAGQFNVAESSVRKAEALAKTDGMGFDKVARGEKTLNAAVTESKQSEKAKQTAAEAEAAESKLLDPIREKHVKDITKLMGDEFGVAFGNGIILKTEKELNAFLDLPKEDKKMIGPLLVQKWEVERARKFMLRLMTGEDRLKDFVLQAAGFGKTMKLLVNGWVVTARKAAEGEGI